MSEDLRFRISSGLKNIIGRDLITDDFIAIFELVKNSYDALAKEVSIKFEDDRIIIVDDGKGMSYDDLLNKWLFVAYSAKKEGAEDTEIKDIRFHDYRNKIQSNRFYAGSKGIGRFSCDKLGGELTLITRKAAANAISEKLKVNWSDFEIDPQKEFAEVTIKHSTPDKLEDYPNFKHGTILEILNLRESAWPRNKILDLKHSLEKLINPFNIIEQKNSPRYDFSIVIQSEKDQAIDKTKNTSRDRVNGPVKNFVFETLKLKTTQIHTEIDDKGKFITTKLSDRGALIYKIREPNTTSPRLQNISIYLFYLNRAAKMKFTSQMGLHSVQFGSVFLFRNGFRVYPFGEEGKDALGLDRRKQQKAFGYLGTRELIGRIEIIDIKDVFKEASSRDGGLIRSPHYDELVDLFYKKCLRRLESYVVDISWQIKEDALKEDLSALENSESKSQIVSLISKISGSKDIEILDYNKDIVNITKEKLEEVKPSVFSDIAVIAKKTKDGSLLKEIKNAEKKYEKIIKERIEAERRAQEEEEARQKAEEALEIERQKNTFLHATSRGISHEAQGLIHNIKLSSTNINAELHELISRITEDVINKKDVLKRLASIKIHTDKMLKISNLITRANFKADAEKQKVDVVKYIEQYIGAFKDMYTSSTMHFDVDTKAQSYWAKVSVLELSIIMDNLISNATKAGANKIKIEFVKTRNETLKFIFSDNGRGVAKKYLDKIDQIFELGVTETTGSGIGLYTVKSLLRHMKGSIEFVGNGKVYRGAAFQIVLNG